MPEEELWTAHDVATYLGMNVEWVYAQSRAGEIPTVNLGRYKRYRRASIEQWVKDKERGS